MISSPPILRRILSPPALVVAIALASLASGTSAAAPAAYVALGDSYSSGVGAKRYVSRSGPCRRSPQSWVHRLGRKLTTFRACSAATIGDVLALQLEPFPDNTRLVTITVGANDANFGAVLSACLFDGPADCDSRVDRAERYVRHELPARLRRVFDAIRRRAPQATVIVAGYPRLVARRPWCGDDGTLDDGEQRRLNEGSDVLARTTAAEVGRHRGFRFADVRTAFDGHEVCSSAPWIHGAGSSISAFHPNGHGYAAYGRVARSAL
ncbi:MAG: hypothetical protein QOI73_929 [Solirubrobacteraceae bacterium]|nr:hypothetical protein [Solirubrobacteraceae bacterium]